MAYTSRSTATILLIPTVLLATALVGLANPGNPDPKAPDAAAIVEAIIAQESKIHRFPRIWIRTKGTWTQTEKGIQAALRRIKRETGEDKVPPDRLDEVRPSWEERGELIFDETRVAITSERLGTWKHRAVWNGTIGKSLWDSKDSACLAIDDRCSFFQHPPSLGWLKLGTHRFWWSDRDVWTGYGPPSDFDYVGRTKFRDHDCFVLQNGSWAKLYIDAENHRLRGMTTSIFEHYFEDYRQVAPGLLVPWKHGYTVFAKDEGKTFRSVRRDIEITDFKIMPELDDDLFAMKPPEGALTTDSRFQPALHYRFKADRTEEELEQLRRRQHADQVLLQDKIMYQKTRLLAMLATPAPELPDQTWLNSPPLSWQDVAGRMVILDFFSAGCAPCRSGIEQLVKLHKEGESTGITIIGVHTPTENIDGVRAFLEEMRIKYPVVIEPYSESPVSGFGKVSKQYAAGYLPNIVLIDTHGCVDSFGSVTQVIAAARRLARKASR